MGGLLLIMNGSYWPKAVIHKRLLSANSCHSRKAAFGQEQPFSTRPEKEPQDYSRATRHLELALLSVIRTAPWLKRNTFNSGKTSIG